jgi:2-polyprenyl-3-methyl-5-hydroxy-6-metoxy-1,4-benzoquinol methylase
MNSTDASQQPAGPTSDEEVIRRTFEQFWSSGSFDAEMDDAGTDIFHLLLEELGEVRGKRMIEVGSGSGRISAALAQAGASVTLLDNSPAALGLSARIFQERGLDGSFCHASAFSMPFRDGSFDVVWNTGVLEHFLFDDQRAMLAEMLRIVRPAGVLMTFNPSHEGRIYRTGKTLLTAIGRWPYGREIPIKTLRPHCERIGANLVREFNAAFDLQFYYFLRFGLPLKNFFRTRPRLNARLGKHCGGYLKVSIIRKAPPSSA